MQVMAEGIANHRGRGAMLIIHAQANLANAGTMKVIMNIPVASPEFSFHYSGSLSKMDLSPLNSMLEISDQMRIKTGVLEEATFDVNVVSGHASGTLMGVYRDLTLAAINKKTGSEKGFSNGIKSFIAGNESAGAGDKDQVVLLQFRIMFNQSLLFHIDFRHVHALAANPAGHAPARIWLLKLMALDNSTKQAVVEWQLFTAA